MANYFEQVCKTVTLKNAWEKVQKKGSAGGLDGINPGDFSEKKAESMLSNLQKELLNQTYLPIPYDRSAIPKFNEANEKRQLSLPAVKDKIVQQAVVEILNPVFEKKFYDCSYAYRKGKGHYKAIRRAEHIITTQKIAWSIPMDVDNFFDTLDHNLLLTQFSKEVDDAKLIKLIKLWIKTGSITRKGDWLEADSGISQGSVISPLLSNIYLHDLDDYAVQQQYNYIRYSDNLIVFTQNKEQSYEAFKNIRQYLNETLKLQLNSNPYPFKSMEKGFVFLGIYFKNTTRAIASTKENKVFKKINWLTDKQHQKKPELTLKKINESVEGTKRHYAFLKPDKQFQAFDNHLFKRLMFLLTHFIKFEILVKKDLPDYVKQIQWYSSYPETELSSFQTKLINDVHSLLKVNRQKTETLEKQPVDKNKKRVTGKRETTNASKFLRRIADQAEVIVSSHGVFLGKTSNRLIIKKQRRIVEEIPFSKVKNISINSNGITLSSDFIFQCAKSKIPISFFTYTGKPYAIINSPIYSMGEISVLQIKAYETEKALKIDQSLLIGKSKNQMNLLKFYLRSRRKTNPDFSKLVDKNLLLMKKNIEKIKMLKIEDPFSLTRDKLMITEAQISLKYWEGIKQLIPSELEFKNRQHKGSSDVVNQMLNYGYGILYQKVWNAISKAGLNPYISFLHAFQKNKPTLVYDMIEEFRQPFVDKAIFSILTKGNTFTKLKINPDNGLLSNATRDIVIKAVLRKLAGLITFRHKKVKGENIIDIQADNMVAFLKEKKTLKPFISSY